MASPSSSPSSLSFLSSFILSFLLRPSLWVGLVSIVAYWDNDALHGTWVYDDSGSVAKNVVVIGQVPWTDAFTRDYWGTSMQEISSHKSFRPVTTLSFKLNHLWNEQVLGIDGLDTYSYRLVNLVLHGIVSVLVTEAAAFVFWRRNNSGVTQEVNLVAQLMTGFLFALHPVHTEVVSNVTSRGEMFMSIFFLMAFLSFASHLPTQYPERNTVRSMVGIYVVPFVGMFFSLFSKEQGATTLISLVIYDFLRNHESVHRYLEDLLEKRDCRAVAFLRRTIILAIQTVALAGFRYWLNGETSPDFIFDQNPAGFSTDRLTRTFSLSWVYCLYVLDAVFPKYLCPDWSGLSIDLIENGSDKRIWWVLALWTFAAWCTFSLFYGPTSKDKSTQLGKDGRTVVLMAFFAFTFSPFLLSSNILVVVGLMKADRVIYLPLLGFCLLEAQLFKTLLDGVAKTKRQAFTGSLTHWTGYLLFMTQLLLLTRKTHERNHAWSNSLSLWVNAFDINPRSHHTMYNCGYELSIKQRYEESEYVLRPIGNPRVDGPSNTFVYVMVLYNLHRCDEAMLYIKEAYQVLDEKRTAGGPRNLKHMLDRSESNLMIAEAHCTEDLTQKGKIMYDAVQKDQTNPYAIQQAKALMERLDKLRELQKANPGLQLF